MSYKEGYEEFVDEDGDFVDTVYTEQLSAFSRDGNESFDLCIPHGNVQVGIYEDIMIPEVVEYLDNSGFIIPEYLTPNPEQLVSTCQICGREAFYYLRQKPEEESADLRIMLNNPEGDIVFIDARLSSWRDDDRMIAFLAENLSFR